jgi:uncharacterized protein YlxP (DUF503 family)
MWVGSIEFDLLLGEVGSLKEKRSLVRPLIAELRRTYQLSVAEVGHLDLHRRAGGTAIRLASKSVRVPELIRRGLGHPGFQGVLSYTLAEALWLSEHDVCDDVVVAYPSVDRAALTRLVESPRAAARITLMVDDPAHLDVIDSVRASHAVPVRVAIDIDAGLRMGRQHVGPKRSPLYDAAGVVRLARCVADRPGFRLAGERRVSLPVPQIQIFGGGAHARAPACGHND